MKKSLYFFIAIALLLAFTPTLSPAADIRYKYVQAASLLMGRALGCGLTCTTLDKKVVKYVENNFEGKEQEGVIIAMLAIMEREREAQKKGATSDSCETVKAALEKVSQ